MVRIIGTLILCFFATAAFSEPVSSQGGKQTVYKCTPTKFTKCKADKQGRVYDCREFTGEKCVAVGGPGSGKAKQ